MDRLSVTALKGTSFAKTAKPLFSCIYFVLLEIQTYKYIPSNQMVIGLLLEHVKWVPRMHFSPSLFSPDNSSAIAVSASPSGDITEGGALRLACCSPAAGPQAIFRWHKSTSTSPPRTGRVWSIGEVTSDDSGSYYCQIHTADKVQTSKKLHIDVECEYPDLVFCASEGTHR